MSPIFLERFDKDEDGLAVDVLVAFCSEACLDVRALADAVEEEIAKALVPDRLLVVMQAASVDEARDAFEKSTQGEALTGRLEGRCDIELIGYDGRGQETRREALTEGQGASRIGLEEILRRGVTSIFARRGGFVQASASYHFANPSGAHTDRFMRLSNILVRQAEISFVALAVMRRLPGDARQVYVDTPALYAVVSAINEQWRTTNPGRATLVADNFSSYFSFDEHRFTDVARSVAIISASSSGRLARKLVETKGFDPARIVHALYLGPKTAGPDVAVDLGCDRTINPKGFSTERRTFEADDCALCRSGSVAITLKGDQFDIAGPQHPPLMIGKNDAPRGLADAMARMVGARALRVTTGSRLFDVDPRALLGRETFRDRLDYLVRRLVPARVDAVVLVDPDAAPLLDRMMEIVGKLPPPPG